MLTEDGNRRSRKTGDSKNKRPEMKNRKEKERDGDSRSRNTVSSKNGGHR